jgi:hypothetical protein
MSRFGASPHLRNLLTMLTRELVVAMSGYDAFNDFFF